MPAGRPTKYEPRFCEAVVEAAERGLSLTAFAGEIGVDRSSISAWVGEHPEFSVAVNRAKALTLAWYEKHARRLVEEGGTGAQATLVVFGLKNMGADDWKDRQEVQHTGGVQITISKDDASL